MAARTAAIYGPGLWTERHGPVWSHRDRWFALVAVAEAAERADDSYGEIGQLGLETWQANVVRPTRSVRPSCMCCLRAAGPPRRRAGAAVGTANGWPWPTVGCARAVWSGLKGARPDRCWTVRSVDSHDTLAVPDAAEL